MLFIRDVIVTGTALHAMKGKDDYIALLVENPKTIHGSISILLIIKRPITMPSGRPVALDRQQATKYNFPSALA